MKVSCQACGAKYTIADDKVRGRKVKIRCKSCGTPIVVDGNSEAPGAPDASAGAEAGGGGTSWSVNLSDTDQRTMTTDEIVAAWKTGELTNDAFVWKDGMGDWVAILENEELKPLLTAAAPGAGGGTPFGPTIVTAPSSPAASARLAGGRSGSSVDLFDASSNRAAPEEEDVATSAPALPTAGMTAYDDGKLTGARNENSVLFSLDALRGGMGPDPKKNSAPAKKPSTAPVGPDPFAMSPADHGTSNALFTLNANQALLTAPAPPEPPPPRITASGAVAAQPMNKLVVYGGGAAAAVVLLLVGLFLGRSGNKPEATDSSSKDNAAAASSADSDKKTDSKSDSKADSKPDEKPADSAGTSASAAPSATSSAAPTASATTPSPSPASTAKLATTPKSTSTPSAPKEPKEPKAPKASEATMPDTSSAPFSVSAAQVALTQAASNAQSCAKPAGPTGSGKVQVTFATSGRVTTATVMGPPFAGTPVGGCVAGVFRKGHVPAFAGNPVTVSKSFSIH
jgi:predicted Zn finger-like uncharacterized protein